MIFLKEIIYFVFQQGFLYNNNKNYLKIYQIIQLKINYKILYHNFKLISFNWFLSITKINKYKFYMYYEQIYVIIRLKVQYIISY